MKKYLLIIYCVFSVQYSFGQRNFKNVNDFIEHEMQNWNIPNVSIAIVNKDSILFQKEYGKDKSHGNYLIGSISKSFTAMAVMQLYEKGALDINTPVQHYLPWFELKNKTVSTKITVRHLLNQTSGLAKSAGFFTPKSQIQTEIEQEYKLYLQSLNIDETAIGETHIYCNLNYQILGQLIQKVSGLEYGDYVKKYLFTPLGMQNSFATYEETKQAGLKNGYQYVFGFPIKHSFTYNNNGIAAGDISSNTEDMSKFLRALLNNGITQTDTVIDKAILAQMHTPFSNRYGMGFSIGDWNGLHSIRHTGLSKNYSSAINIFPNENYGIVILTNINSLYAVRNLMDGSIRRLNHQEEIRYTPYEIYFRYFILAILIWGVVDLALRTKRWSKQQFQIRFSMKFKMVFQLMLNILLAIVWLVVVPYFANIPLLKMPALQPDLGYALIIGAFFGLCSAFIKYFIKSNTVDLNADGKNAYQTTES